MSEGTSGNVPVEAARAEATPAEAGPVESASVEAVAAQAAPVVESAPPMEPVSLRERIEVIDIVRGLALFGIIAANMRGFFGPANAYMDPGILWRSPADRIAQGLIDWLIQGKFVTIFSFLFGLGFAVQMLRAEERGRKIRFYPRRLAILLAIGCIHAFLIWWGDILISYALVGFMLLLFRKRKQKTVAVWLISLELLMVVMIFGWYISARLGHAPPMTPPKLEKLQQTIQIYAHGSWLQILRQRFKEWVGLNAFFVFTPIFLLPRFLSGLWLWRSGIIRDLPQHRNTLRTACLVGALAGLPLNAAAALISGFETGNAFSPTGVSIMMNVALTVGVPALSICYVSGVALLTLSEKWRPRVHPFAAVGRMALTTYLMQSIICTLLFYSYGLGWFGRIGPALGLIPTFAVYGAQIWFANWWLSRWQFGPAEWLWRSLTYGRFQPMRVEAPAAAAAM